MTSQPPDVPLLDEMSRWMKRDWDRRATENARWFINTVRLDQSEDEFDETGLSEIRSLILPELILMTRGRDPRSLRMLEIGCGIGRMTRHLAAIFGEVCAVDVSGEMIARARERLAGLANVHLHESNGVDLSLFPDEYFDLIFSAYVFQHVPDRRIIESNLTDAWRTLKPGGILRFHVNGVEAESYAEREKDTWAGASYTEPEIRSLARRLGARLVSIYGGNTMFCWTMLRKPVESRAPGMTLDQASIIYHSRADRPGIEAVPLAGDDSWLALVVSGLNAETADANSMTVELGGIDVVPRYVGRVRPHFEAAITEISDEPIESLVYIEAGMPPGMAGDQVTVRVRMEDGTSSGGREVTLEAPRPVSPKIMTVRNAADYGTDIARTGPKSLVQLFVEYLGPDADCENVTVSIGDRLVKPDFVGYVDDIAGRRVDFRVPSDLDSGTSRLFLVYNDAVSEPVAIEIAELSD